MQRRTTRRHWALAWAVLLIVPQLALGDGKVLRVRFDGPVPEKPSQDAELMMFFGGQQSRTLLDWVRLIDKAAEDPDVKAIAMIIEQPQLGLGQLEEITAALTEFRKTGKKVHAYLDVGGNGSYALACAADTITIAEHSDLNVVGIYAELTYFKNLLDKIGVVAQFTHCGAYKSALEPFTRTGPSPEAAENVNWLLDGLYDSWVGLIAKGRGMPVEKVKALVDEGPWSAEKALKAGLVDYVGSFADFKRMIRKEYGKDVEVVKKLTTEDEREIDFENPFAIFQLLGELMQKQQEPREDGIALIYVAGNITTGKTEEGPFGGGNAGSTTIRAAFEKAFSDDAVKAIVVRVDSPGGSAIASDIMWKAATRCASEKPVIVSMGDVAGSGGYYVSVAGDVIFADRATITASIGVVGGKFVWKDLMEGKLGITHASFARGKHSGLWSMNRLWNEEEMQLIQDYMNEVYEQFKSRIRQSRGDRLKKDLEEIAGGRVFTGSQALELGLIDRIGGLSDAIEYAVKKAGLGDDYELYVLPEPKNPLDAIVAALTGQEQEDEWEMSITTRRDALAADPLLRAMLPLVQRLGPDQAATLMNVMDRIEMINREHFGCLMPFELTIR